jgi:Ca2+-binding EF-hand superfamily protein
LEYAVDDKVNREKFPDLLGLLGTDIAYSFAQRIFDTFSSDGKYLTLFEYLKYIDLYHHGNEKERCIITFRFIDSSNTNKVNFADFEKYINIIITAIKKVHPGSEDNLLTTKEIQVLFKKIACGKDYFTYHDFEHIYFNKPHLLSWIDYFKNNDHELLTFLNTNIKIMLIYFDRFSTNIIKILQSISNLNGFAYDFKEAINEIEIYTHVIEEKKKEFQRANSIFNIKNIFSDIYKPKEKKKSFLLINLEKANQGLIKEEITSPKIPKPESQKVNIEHERLSSSI